MAQRQRRGTQMSGAEFRAMRVEMGLSVADVAGLLALKEQTIRNIEGEQTPPGHQTAFLLKLLAYPQVQTLVKKLRTLENTP